MVVRCNIAARKTWRKSESKEKIAKKSLDYLSLRQSARNTDELGTEEN